MISKEEYLYRRGWYTSTEVIDKKISFNLWHKKDGHKNLELNSAFNLQLNADAEVIDFIALHRSKNKNE
jgi:hypothetical protein